MRGHAREAGHNVPSHRNMLLCRSASCGVRGTALFSSLRLLCAAPGRRAEPSPPAAHPSVRGHRKRSKARHPAQGGRAPLSVDRLRACPALYVWGCWRERRAFPFCSGEDLSASETHAPPSAPFGLSSNVRLHSVGEASTRKGAAREGTHASLRTASAERGCASAVEEGKGEPKTGWESGG
jgi:hypothetical protein